MSDDYPIPQSNALRQVDRLSLQELFSRDPETLGESLMDIVTHMQELRDRLAATETVRQVRVRQPSASPSAPIGPPKRLTSAAQLGLVRKPS
jgi:hypothetical protein